jgi:hypothetical protein
MVYDTTTQLRHYRLDMSPIEECIPQVSTFLFVVAALLRMALFQLSAPSEILHPVFLFCLCLNMFLCFCRLIGFMEVILIIVITFVYPIATQATEWVVLIQCCIIVIVYSM